MSTKRWTTGATAAGIAGATAGPATALLPSRTACGRALVGQVRGLLGYPRTVQAENIPSADREMVVSRSLSHAVVRSMTRSRWWSRSFA
ncbi:hypothetical protein AB0L41_42420 [Amycolatopsis mediterranei]|uniref:hypothetical protein n=1 Tax=Amycolatopsis mediterranei TaxID=33910 RepID=UPI00342AD6E3